MFVTSPYLSVSFLDNLLKEVAKGTYNPQPSSSSRAIAAGFGLGVSSREDAIERATSYSPMRKKKSDGLAANKDIFYIWAAWE